MSVNKYNLADALEILGAVKIRLESIRTRPVRADANLPGAVAVGLLQVEIGGVLDSLGDVEYYLGVPGSDPE